MTEAGCYGKIAAKAGMFSFMVKNLLERWFWVSMDKDGSAGREGLGGGFDRRVANGHHPDHG